MINLAQLGRLIAGLRVMRSKTQAELAAAVTAAGIPLSSSTLSAIEMGTTAPRVDLLWAILTCLQASPDIAWSIILGLPDWVTEAATPPAP